jgi:hypothetical protein
LEMAEAGAGAEEPIDTSKKRKEPSNEERGGQAFGVAALEEQGEQRPRKKSKKDSAQDAAESAEREVSASQEVSLESQTTDKDGAPSIPKEPKKKKHKKKGTAAMDEPGPQHGDNVEPAVVQTKETLVVVEEPTPDDAQAPVPDGKSKKKKKRAADKALGTEKAPVSEEAAHTQQVDESARAITPSPAPASSSRPEERVANGNEKVEKKKKNKKKDAASDLAEAITRAAEVNGKQGPGHHVSGGLLACSRDHFTHPHVHTQKSHRLFTLLRKVVSHPGLPPPAVTDKLHRRCGAQSSGKVKAK